MANEARKRMGRDVKQFQKGSLILIPRVTDMRNGLYRPEVVFSKARGGRCVSDVVFGDAYDNYARAALLADMVAQSATMNAQQLRGLFAEIGRAVAGCQRHVEALAAAV